MEKYYTLDEITDEFIGPRGTPERETFEAEIESVLIGAAIKSARRAQHLTQKQLGERVGVQAAQISKIESGRNLTITTIIRVLNALGLTADFTISGLAPITIGGR